MPPRVDPIEFTPCRFCGEPCDNISNSCQACRRMKGKMSDKAFLAQVMQIVRFLHAKHVTRGVDLTLVKRKEG